MKQALSEVADNYTTLCGQKKFTAFSKDNMQRSLPDEAISIHGNRRPHKIDNVGTLGEGTASAPAVFEYVAGKPAIGQIIMAKGAVTDPYHMALIPAQCESSPIFIFTDETVGRLYGLGFKKQLQKAGYNVHYVVLPDGETSKTIASYVWLVERVLSIGVDEHSVFISLGGGVVCNVCGFVASTIYRGLQLIHIPTSLMAQCDAAISHKQAINGGSGKNMIGSYYQPQKVVVDVETLQTLTERQISDGYAEIIKHALGQSPSFVRELLSYSGNIREPEFLEQTIRRNIAFKCELAKTDPREQKEAMVLQYGHTVGHPIEHLSGYALYHGESVAIGMMVASRVSRILGASSHELVSLHERLLSKYGLPVRIPRGITKLGILEALRYNKRHLPHGNQMALLSEVGKLWRVEDEYAICVPNSVLSQAISETMELS